jgi:hypothetical protein
MTVTHIPHRLGCELFIGWYVNHPTLPYPTSLSASRGSLIKRGIVDGVEAKRSDRSHNRTVPTLRLPCVGMSPSIRILRILEYNCDWERTHLVEVNPRETSNPGFQLRGGRRFESTRYDPVDLKYIETRTRSSDTIVKVGSLHLRLRERTVTPAVIMVVHLTVLRIDTGIRNSTTG